LRPRYSCIFVNRVEFALCFATTVVGTMGCVVPFVHAPVGHALPRPALAPTLARKASIRWT
jgi:hypothetical protein